MSKILWFHPVYGGIIPFIIGWLFLYFSFRTPCFMYRIWPTWIRSKDISSMESVGIFTICLGTMNILPMFIGHYPGILHWFMLPLLVLSILLHLFYIKWRNPKKEYTVPQQRMMFITKFTMVFSTLIILRWPWDLAYSGVVWHLPFIFKTITLIGFAVGYVLIIIIISRILVIVIVDFLKNRKGSRA